MIDHRIPLRGLTHHVVEHHPEGAPTLVLLHGYLDHAHIFDKLAAELPELRLLAIDLRGHGDTDPVGAGGYYHFFDYVADVHGLIAHLAKPPVALLGHSMGGGVAAYLAGAFPSLISHLCLIEGIGPPPMSFDEGPARVRGFIEDLARVATRPRRRFPSLEAAADRVRERNPRITPADALAFAQHGTRPGPPPEDGVGRDGADGFVWKFDPLHQTRAPTPFLEELILPFLRAITAKTLIIEGSEGYLLAPEVRARRVELLRSVHTLFVPGAGHHVQLDAPSAIAGALRRMLA